MSVDVDSHLGQPRARGTREASIRPATTTRPVIEARCEGETRCVTPRQTWPRPNGFRSNLHSKTRWFMGFYNSHQVSHFAMFFIDARAEISVTESRFHLQKKRRSHRRTPRMRREGQAIDSSIPWRFPRWGFDNDPSASSHTETLLRLLLPLNDKDQPGSIPHRRRRRMSPACPRGARGGADGFKVSATVVCKERRTGQIRADEGPMPTASAASENLDRRSRTTTSHEEARESWDARAAFRFAPRTKCEGRRAIDKT
ncbi:hypothetical protein CQW23_34231 [Capsicum baccatum]|uniref:Protein TAR1 n=1 Tax=Capsicum baccatum TaxID=33114 RepID=A0A2G2UZL8_CAPBA|nr:hypothetical protein CQW23_34231 [Capsicum baccatum]